MFPEHSDVAMYGLEFSPAAVVRARAAETCAFCNVPPIDVHGSDAAKLRWLDAQDPGLAAAVRAAAAPAGSEESGPLHPFYALGAEGAGWRDELRRLIWDSQLEPTLPLPLEQLDEILAGCDGDLREFLCDRLVFAVCGFCRASDISGAGLGQRLREIYLREHYEGSSLAAKAQPAWNLAERSFALIDAAALRAQSA
jgi:hypothetical protein